MGQPAGSSDVPLTVFGGAVCEMAPEDLPEGASPYNQDVDYVPGNTFTRAGRRNQVTFANLFQSRITAAAASVPGPNAPNEVPWANPINAQLGLPGTYATAGLNVGFVPGLPGSVTAQTNGSGPTNWASVLVLFKARPGFAPVILQADLTGNITHTTAGSTLIIAGIGNVLSVPNPPVTWAPTDNQGNTYNIINATQNLGNGDDIAMPQVNVYAAFATAGGPITININQNAPHGFNGSVYCIEVTNLIGVDTSGTALNPNPAHWSVTSAPCSATPTQAPDYAMFFVNGQTTHLDISVTGQALTWNAQNPGVTNNQVWAAPGGTAAGNSQYLTASNFGFALPSTVSVLGFQVEIDGNQSSLDPGSTITVSLVNPSPAGSPSFTVQLPLADGVTLAGTPTTSWNLALTPALFNNPAFAVQLYATASAQTIFSVYAVRLKVWLSPQPPQNFNWVKTYEQTDGALTTLALDAAGALWQEDAINNPGVLNNITLAIEPNTFADSDTFDDVEYIALSDLVNGTDVPRLWNGQFLDRVSQVGPGAPPQATGIASGSTITNITQNPVQNIPTSTGGTTGSWIVWSAGPSADGTFGNPATPGNVMTWVFPRAYTIPSYIKVGSNIVISGVQTMNGYNPNSGVGTNPAYYTVTSVGQPDPSQQYYDGFTITLPQTGFYNLRFQAGSAYQSTLATLTTAAQVPFLEVNNAMTVQGNSNPSYNNTWTVQQTPNAAQLSISNTSLTGGIATYAFSLLTGTTPTPGEFVTVTGTLNGGGIFNVKNGVINTAGPNTFTIVMAGPNVTGAPETGNGIISGTIFIFDPAGTVANPIIGTGTGGTIATSGVLGIGTRQLVCLFKTRTGYITPASPFVQFNITGNQTAISVSQIPIGPPDVVARILAFTGGNGANYFYISQPVTVTSNGQQVTYSSTVINDNITTTATLSFPDAVLLAGNAIDITGNNNFSQMELGACTGFISYASRLFAWGEQNKVQNFINLSFDGGVGSATAALQNLGAPVTSYPLGWTVDPTLGGGVALINSPIFGTALQINNTTGLTQTAFGLIYQNAFQDQYGVPIIRSGTSYSVRLTAACPSGAASGALNVQLYSPKLNQAYGFFTIPLASMASTMQIFTGTLLTNQFGTVPADLQLRVYTSNIPAGTVVQLDRIEPFDSSQPVFSTQLRGSYQNNPQAFDLVTGACGPAQNQQPVKGCMVLFDILYALKTGSWFSTSDNGVTEPNGWTWKTVSNKVGTVGIHSYDYGEGWSLSANRAGVYFFDGGEPVKINQEYASLWEMINWQYGHTIWLRNDAPNRRILIGVPIATGPTQPSFQYLPEIPANPNPTSPNVVIAMNYRELNSGRAIAEVGPIKATFSGRIMSPEPARKTSFWNIQAPYADFVKRMNESSPLWLCSGYQDSKLFILDPTQLSDDGAPINSFYITYGFVKADMADAKGLGLHRMTAAYLTALVTGTGNLKAWVYPDTPQNNLPFVLDDLPLPAIGYGDLELGPVDGLSANRFFTRFGTNAVGAAFRLSKVVWSLHPDMWAPVRGSATGSQY